MADQKKSKNINLEVVLDEDNLPSVINFSGDDHAGSEPIACKGMLLSLFDKKDLSTLKLDLWSKDMQVIEMDRFMFQSLKALVDTYHNATRNTELANEMQRFVQYFGEKTGIIQSDKPS